MANIFSESRVFWEFSLKLVMQKGECMTVEQSRSITVKGSITNRATARDRERYREQANEADLVLA